MQPIAPYNTFNAQPPQPFPTDILHKAIKCKSILHKPIHRKSILNKPIHRKGMLHQGMLHKATSNRDIILKDMANKGMYSQDINHCKPYRKDMANHIQAKAQWQHIQAHPMFKGWIFLPHNNRMRNYMPLLL
ncbi:hypothetical protein SNOG_09521 [Parastagonospora nodorum SN15]|uniref:Uncharacterized protein n=1 Tax=Phaeosphaeria nodorum (strain SN15 / ATCC MYA-4574 / FGSC 10173) TaxID=321614 RepID=Q0UFE3_PHANO|nr:hypothetical protein SNOG_09521 [Parastagonospora nodorum SN15]EAT82786.2 hypothetical protein SNOG_09521 [Parastagonospora nodorum SN15]